MTKRRKKEAFFGILFALPVMLGFLIFVLSPLVDVYKRQGMYIA